MRKKLRPILILTLLLTCIGTCIPRYEGEGGGGVEGCFTGCRGGVQSGGGIAYFSGPMPFSGLIDGQFSYGRWHFGLPDPALYVDAYPSRWFGRLSLWGLSIDAFCAWVVALAIVLVPWPNRSWRPRALATSAQDATTRSPDPEG
jgi:hypothetical protein